MAKKIRGYSSYRGKSPLWKIALTVLLVAVILASVGILTLERSIVYDSDGVPRIEFSWQKGDKVPEGADSVPDLSTGSPDNAGEPSPEGAAEENPSAAGNGEASGTETGSETGPEEARESFHAYAVQAAPLTNAIYGDVQRILVQNPQYNAVSVRLKDEEGWVYFRCAAVLSNSSNLAEDTTEALSALTGSSVHTIARIACFHDSIRAQWDDKTRLRNTGGYIFYDGNDENWMDPTKADARAYLCALAASAAEQGFDEILLTDVGYPTEGKLNKIAYGETPLGENLSAFLSEMRDTLAPYHVILSVELPKSVLLNGGVDVSGQSLTVSAPYADRIYAKVEPGEIAACASAVAAVRDGAVAFVPELSVVPDPAPERYLLIPFPIR